MSETSATPRSPIITITLPHLSAQEALVLLDILENLHSKIWHVHGGAVAELLRLRSEAPPPDDINPDDDLPF